jgi:hypothetical protein
VERGVGGVGAYEEVVEEEEEEEEEEEACGVGVSGLDSGQEKEKWGCLLADTAGTKAARTMSSSLVGSTFLPATFPVSLHAATSESS